MSLILDALRKSEAERRRGQAPSLYSQAPVPGTRPRPPWLTLLPIAGGVLLVLAAAVYWLRDDAPVTKDELVEESEDSLVSPEAAQAGAPAVAPPPPVTNPVAIVAAPASVSAPAPSVDALVKPAPAKPVDVAPAPGTIVAAEPAPPAEEPLPPVAVLDPSTRSGLPPMKLSMHVYNIDPARRFAIIDGQRVAEGAQIGNAIVLEIRRDGVVLDVAGKRVLLPRP
jgi:general secretion pathway protein B